MPCFSTGTIGGAPGIGPADGNGFATEAECLEQCVEGACCENGTCTIKPRCQCNAPGAVFAGNGVPCSPDPCNPLP